MTSTSFCPAHHAQADSYALKFADGYKLTIADSDIRIHDCTSRKPAQVEVSNSWWTIDGVTIPVKADSSVPDEESLPVYVYFAAYTSGRIECR